MAWKLRYELLPFDSALEQAQRLSAPLALTVTCSPRHGPDHSVAVAERLRSLGHTLTVHLAARMVCGQAHLDELLGRLRAAGIDDLFIVGGDVGSARGPYRRGLDLLAEIRGRADAPATLGVPAYPEGHPQIPPAALLADLQAKQPLADYMVTQLCFDPERLRDWLEHARLLGIELPAHLGVPGVVDRRRLLEISLRVGVGPSLSYLRKNGHVARGLGRGVTPARSLLLRLPAELPDSLGVVGVHMFTFNRLLDTLALTDQLGGVLR